MLNCLIIFATIKITLFSRVRCYKNTSTVIYLEFHVVNLFLKYCIISEYMNKFIVKIHSYSIIISRIIKSNGYICITVTIEILACIILSIQISGCCRHLVDHVEVLIISCLNILASTNKVDTILPEYYAT